MYADANGNDAFDAGEISDTTAADGSYSLAGLAPGTYAVRVVAAGWTCSAPAGCEHALTLASGQTASGADFGLYTAAVISGRVTDDSDGDGSADGGEPGLQGRTVWVDLDGDGDLDAGEPSTTTDADGDYTLPGVDPGAYTVRVELPSGWNCSPDCSAPVTVGSGDTPTCPSTSTPTPSSPAPCTTTPTTPARAPPARTDSTAARSRSTSAPTTPSTPRRPPRATAATRSAG